MLFRSENILQLHTKLTVLFWVSIKILYYEEVQNSPTKIYSWEAFDLISRMDISIFFTASIWGKIFKKSFSENTEWTKHQFEEGWSDKGALGGVQKPHSLQAPAGRRLQPLTAAEAAAAAALAPAQCSHRALITRLHGVQMDPLQAYVPNVKGSVLLHSTISFPHPVPFYKEEPDLFCFLLPYVLL